MRWERGKPKLCRSLAAASAIALLAASGAAAQPVPEPIPAAAEAGAWSAADIVALQAALGRAAAHGLDANPLRRALASAEPGDDTRLDEIALAYARALAMGVVDPKRLHAPFTLETNQRDLAGELQAALREQRLGDWLATLAPRDDDYRAVSGAYLQARAAARAKPADAALTQRARTLALNLERRRWLDRSPPDTRIDVNVAAAKLWFFKDGEMLDSRKVVVGARGHETPLLQASFSRLVVNPPWLVPTEIARREILPKGRRYLERHDMKIVNGRVIQDPGPESSLGLVKFDLRDDEDIYLHDTNAQSAFERADRHLSHGCVRVEDAVGFAHLVADQFGAADRFEDKLASGETGAVSLGAEVPVRLLYLTAYVEEGEVRLAKDAYGWDADLAQALGLGEAATAIPLKLGQGDGGDR